jgi:hypothetical protein
MESSYAEAVDRQKQDLLEVFEARKRARSVVVPTDDTQVKVRLRELDEPICLFGEGPADRRERLRQLIAEIVESGIATEQKEEKDEQPVSDIVSQQVLIMYVVIFAQMVVHLLVPDPQAVCVCLCVCFVPIGITLLLCSLPPAPGLSVVPRRTLGTGGGSSVDSQVFSIPC